jgi:hypothetical protein
VLWKGLPFYTLVWEVLGIVHCILDMFLRSITSKRTKYHPANDVIVLGACVASLKGKSESRWSSQVVQATKVAPSPWPIAFSGILGSALRALADWRVERGVPLLVRVVWPEAV